jgi:hypothetical protein
MAARLLFVFALVGAVLVGAPASAQTIQGWAPGPEAVGDSTLLGNIDAPADGTSVGGETITVHGWVVDTTAQGWAGVDEVHLYIGTIGAGGKFLGRANVGQPRPDVAGSLGVAHWASSGFSATIPAVEIGTGPKLLTVYAHTPNKGWWSKQSGIQVNNVVGPTVVPTPVITGDMIAKITAPTLGQYVFTNNTAWITGYALDLTTPEANSGISKIDVYLGKREDGGKYLGLAERTQISPEAAVYGRKYGNTAGFRISFEPTKYTSGDYEVWIYARSSSTGKEVTASMAFHIADPA